LREVKERENEEMDRWIEECIRKNEEERKEREEKEEQKRTDEE